MWTIYVNVTILRKYSGTVAHAQAGRLSPPTRPGYEAIVVVVHSFQTSLFWTFSTEILLRYLNDPMITFISKETDES